MQKFDFDMLKGVEPTNNGMFYLVNDVEPILNSLQQLKAEIAALVNNYPTDSWKYDSDRVNSLLAALRQLSAV